MERSLFVYIYGILFISYDVYSCPTTPQLNSPLAPITRSISRMNSAIMRGASILTDENDVDEFEPLTEDDIKNNQVFFDPVKQSEIPEAESSSSEVVSQNPVNYTVLKEELEMINKTKSLLNLFEETAKRLYENGEKNVTIKNCTNNDSSEYDLETSDIKETIHTSSVNKTPNISREENFVKNLTKIYWEKEVEKKRLEEELIKERTKEFTNEKMMSDRNDNIFDDMNKESSGMEIIETSTNVVSTLKAIVKKQKTKLKSQGTAYTLPAHCNDGYVIAITNKPYNKMLIPLHRAEMSSELKHLENYINKRLISWGRYTSHPMNYKGHFSQKYVMKNPKECIGLEKFTKKAVSYGMFMEAGIFQCKCGTIKTISKVH